MAKNNQGTYQTGNPKQGSSEGISFKELLDVAGISNANDLQKWARSTGYTSGQIDNLVRGYNRVAPNASDYIMHDSGYDVLQDGTFQDRSGKKKGNVKGFDAGDLIALGRNVSLLAGALNRSVYQPAKQQEKGSGQKSSGQEFPIGLQAKVPKEKFSLPQMQDLYNPSEEFTKPSGESKNPENKSSGTSPYRPDFIGLSKFPPSLFPDSDIVPEQEDLLTPIAPAETSPEQESMLDGMGFGTFDNAPSSVLPGGIPYDWIFNSDGTIDFPASYAKMAAKAAGAATTAGYAAQLAGKIPWLGAQLQKGLNAVGGLRPGRFGMVDLPAVENIGQKALQAGPQAQRYLTKFSSPIRGYLNAAPQAVEQTAARTVSGPQSAAEINRFFSPSAIKGQVRSVAEQNALRQKMAESFGARDFINNPLFQ